MSGLTSVFVSRSREEGGPEEAGPGKGEVWESAG